MIDGGFIGGIGQLERALRLHDWNREDIRGILVTHGHLDGALPSHCDRSPPPLHLERMRRLASQFSDIDFVPR